MRPFSEAELAVAVAKVRERSEHLADVVMLLADTGARWGEAREWRRRDVIIDLPKPALRVARSRSEGQEVSPTKGRTARTIPLTDRAHAIVKRLVLGKSRDDLLLTGENGASFGARRSCGLRATRRRAMVGASMTCATRSPRSLSQRALTSPRCRSTWGTRTYR